MIAILKKYGQSIINIYFLDVYFASYSASK